MATPPQEGEIDTVELFVHVGVFDDRAAAEAAVRELRMAGLPEEKVGLLTRQPEPDGRFGLADDPTHSRWEEGSAVGAVTGALTGTGLGLVVAAGLIPAVGPVVAGGMLVALLATAGAGAAAGTVVGGLIGLGIPEPDAGYYDEQVRAGRTIVAARTDGPAPWVDEVYRKHGAAGRESLVTNGI